MRTITRLVAGTGAGLAVAASGLILMPAQADDAAATVYVLHAVPDLAVDVYVNDEPLLEGFEPGTLTDAQELPAGSYDLAVYEAGANPDNAEPAISADGVEVPGGANITVVAHLDAEGTPTLTPFVNDVSSVGAGQARLTVRHTAAAPAVDVRANEEVLVPDLANPAEQTADLPAGTVSADVVLAGESQPVIGPTDLELAEGALTIVYAWGSAEAGNLDVAVQSISGLHSAPGGVPSGTGGDADAGPPVGWLLLGAAGLGAAALAGRRLTVRA